MDPVFRLNNCWKYKDENIVAKIKEFIAENDVKDKLTVSYKVVQTMTTRFSEKYEGTLWSHEDDNKARRREELVVRRASRERECHENQSA